MTTWMMTGRIARHAPIVLAVLLAGACGSSAVKSGGSPTSTTLAKLALVKSGGRAADSAAPTPGALAVRPTTYVLDGTLPDLGATASVYRWTAPVPTIADANRFAQALGITADATVTPDGFQATDGHATVLVSTAGGTAQVSYYLGGIDGGSGSGSGGASTGSVGSGIAPDGSTVVTPLPPDSQTTIPSPDTTVPDKLTTPIPIDVPSAQDAEGIARSLLDTMGVLDGQKWDSEVTDGGGIAISCVVGEQCSGNPGPVSARDVAFHLSIGGVRVEGIDWSVTVGEHSQVQSVYGEWGSAHLLGAYDLRTTAAAFDALKKGEGGFGGIEPVARGVPVNALGAPDTVPDTSVTDTVPAPDPIVLHVTGVTLGVSRWDAVDGDQPVVDLVPTYVFHTRDDLGNTSDISLLALDPAAISFAKPPGPVTTVPMG